MSREKAREMQDEILADVEAFVATLTPDEAVCIGQRLAAGAHGMVTGETYAESAAAWSGVLAVYLVALHELFKRSLGATVEHPDGKACGCYDSSGFFVHLVERVLAVAAEIAEGSE